MAPQLERYLYLCDLGDCIQSDDRMETAVYIENCTDGKDELFPCYKGLELNMKMT